MCYFIETSQLFWRAFLTPTYMKMLSVSQDFNNSLLVMVVVETKLKLPLLLEAPVSPYITSRLTPGLRREGHRVARQRSAAEVIDLV